MRSIMLFSQYRRKGLRNAWSLAGMWRWVRNVGIWIVALLAMLAFLQWSDDQAERQDQAERDARHISRLERVIVSCLDHKGMYINGELHVCEIANAHIKQGDVL